VSVTEIKRDCPESVLELLECLLDEAKRGDITELVVLANNGNQFYIEYTHTQDVGKMVGELELIKHSQMNRIIKT